jgi:hypothetical protein
MVSTSGGFEVVPEERAQRASRRARSARTSTNGLDIPAEEYAGSAEVSSEEGAIPVEVQLLGHFETLDGKCHWFCGITANDVLDERHRSGANVTVTTPHGSAEGRLSDVDPWGRFRITGTGRPPF